MQETEERQAERRAAEAARRELHTAWQAALPALLPHLGEEHVSCLLLSGKTSCFCQLCFDGVHCGDVSQQQVVI